MSDRPPDETRYAERMFPAPVDPGIAHENYLSVRKGYQRLVDDGCVVVLGPMISDNSVNLRDIVNQTGVACIGWTGAVRFFGDYCFTVANGDIPTEGYLAANWCAQQGH